jgi:hypothetical protein
MKRNNVPLVLAFVLILGTLQTLKSQDSKSRNIIESLSTPDSVTNATVRIYEDKRIEQLVSTKRNLVGSKQATGSGYRVQVFSSNVQRTAKTDAFRIEKQISDAFPDQAVYVNYVSPFWKVRVGDFKAQSQAQAFRSQLISTLPQMRSEIYIVREQIILSASK